MNFEQGPYLTHKWALQGVVFDGWIHSFLFLPKWKCECEAGPLGGRFEDSVGGKGELDNFEEHA